MEYLYHYTTIDTLALILKNKTFRFNSLINVDDLEEASTADIGQFGKYIFVICFTDKSTEEIPIWNMYAKNGTGIRIKISSKLFADIKSKILYTDDCILIFDNSPYKVKYDRTYTPKVFLKSDTPAIPGAIYFRGKGINLNDLGASKRSCWKFQSEIRYKLIVYKKAWVDNTLYNHIISSENIPIQYYDMPILDEAINNMEITLGYNITPGYAELVNMMVDNFNKTNNANIKVNPSELTNLIRGK